MKIALAQIEPVRGNVMANLAKHIAWVTTADADLIVFPELSLTGYEPTMAKQLATTPDDPRFEPLQQLSDRKNIIICAGMPVGRNIGMIIFKPGKPRELYTKQFLHEDELPFFENGMPLPNSLPDHLALAICYEIAVPVHALRAHEQGAQVYIASVAKTAKGVEKAAKDLANIAKRYSMTALMANCIGMCEDGECAGQSAVWNDQGQLVAQLSSMEEGLLYCHT